MKFAVIETFPDLYWGSNYHYYTAELKDRYKGWTFPEGFFPAIGTLSLGFPKVHSTRIKFSNAGADEPISRCYMILKSVFETLAARSAKSELVNVDILKVANIPNYDYGYLTSLQTFQSTMQALKELHIQVRQDSDPLTFILDHIDDTMEHEAYMQHLKSQWLAPISSQLTSLSLYFDEYWGVFPHLQIEGLKFPSLRYLALGNYTFADDRQLDWLTSLSSLEILMLQNCPILFTIRFTKLEMESLELDTSGWQDVTRKPQYLEGLNDPDAQRRPLLLKTPARWNGYFDRIRLDRPNLIEFGFGCADWSHGADKVQ